MKRRIGKGIAGALVTALDANDAPAAGTATSDSGGRYELLIPTSNDGTPTVQTIKLRASAAGFEVFPSGLRRSLPITLGTGVEDGGECVFTATTTTILLTPMQSAAGTGTIAGKSARPGALIVAEGPVAGMTDVAKATGGDSVCRTPVRRW